MQPSSDDEILKEIRGFVVATFRRGRGQGIEPGTALVTSGIVGPGGIGQLARFLENRFHIRIADEEMVDRNFNSLAAITALVSGKLA